MRFQFMDMSKKNLEKKIGIFTAIRDGIKSSINDIKEIYHDDNFKEDAAGFFLYAVSVNTSIFYAVEKMSS